MSQFFIRAAGSPGVGTVTDVTGTLPIVITGVPTVTPNVTINNATTSTVGAASFNPTEFTVSIAGEVSLIGGPVNPAIQTILGDTGSITGSTVTIYADNAALGAGSSVEFVNSGTVSTLKVTDSNANTIIGNGAGNLTLTSPDNVGLGTDVFAALTSGSGGNVCVGVNCGKDITTGSSNVAMGTATLRTCATGTSNTCIGHNAGNKITGTGNVCLGYQTGETFTSGTYNTLLGYLAGSGYTGAETFNINIGSNVVGSASETYTTRIGLTSGGSKQTACYVGGIDGVNLSTAQVVTEVSGQLGSAVITGGTGITISTATPNEIIITASGTGTLTGITPQFQDDGTTTPGTVITSANPLIYGSTANAAQVVDTWNTTSSATGTLAIEDRTFVTPFVVDASAVLGARGTYTTIGAAITAAAAAVTALSIPQNVYIRPGTYTENPTAQPNVNLIGLIPAGNSLTPAGGVSAVVIAGTITFTQVGTVNISNVTLQTNSAAFLAVTGSAASIVNLENCYLDCSNHSGITYSTSSASSQVNLYNCSGDVGTTGINIFAMSSPGTMAFQDCFFSNSGATTTASTQSAGGLFLRSTFMTSPVTNSGTATIYLRNTTIVTTATNTTALTVGGSGTNISVFSNFESGTASALSVGSTLQLASGQIASSNTNPITGAGTVNLGFVSFVGNAAPVVNTTTQTLYAVIPGSRNTVSPAGSYQVLVSDNVIFASSSTAHTITLPASPSTGESHYIKDVTGTAGTGGKNITVSGNGVNIDGAATYVISSNYGSVEVCFNGSTWSIV